MTCNVIAHEEEVRRFPFLYIESVKSPDGCVLDSNREMRDAFRAQFRDRFPHCPNLPIQEFYIFLADLPRLRQAEAVRVWWLNVTSVMRWSRSTSINHRDNIVYITRCTWGYCTRLCLFWQICSTIGSPREPSLVALPRARSHCWRKMAGMFGNT